MSMQQFSDDVTDKRGNAVANVQVKIMQGVTPVLASIYADSEGLTAADNPLTTDEKGDFSFFAPTGVYQVWIGGELRKFVTLEDTDGMDEGTAPPTTGTWPTGWVRKNTARSVLGGDGNKYIVDRWECIQGGTPGVWVEFQDRVALPASAVIPSAPAPSSGTSAAGILYTARVQGENMTGATPASDIAGFDGTGYAEQATVTGTTYTASFSSVPAGTYTVNVRSFIWTNQNNSVQIDSATPVAYDYTTRGAWSVQSITGVSLTAGSHAVSVIAGSGFQRYDYVELVQHAAAAAPAPAPAPAPAAASTTGANYPFGSRLDLISGAYPHGISVTGYTTGQMDALLETDYDAWKNNRLAQAAPFTAKSGIYAGQTITDGYVVKFRPANPGEETFLTVSEGVGYGMLICVLFAGYDQNAKKFFDGLLKVARGRPAYAMPSTAGANQYLMEWRLYPDMSSAGQGWSACDGDLDIAYALLMAHRQWGSSGAINYYQEALNTIGALKSANFAPNGVMWQAAPWQNVSRTSDYMIGHFHAFKRATNDTFWDSAVTNSLALLDTVITNYAPTTGLVPGWIYQPITSTPSPSPGFRVEADHEGDYDANAVRVPLRLGTGFLLNGDTDAQAITTKIVATLKTACSADPTRTCWIYDLSARPLDNLYYEPSTCAALMVGSMTDSAHQAFLNALFTQVANNFNTGYYFAELSLLALVVASGNWWLP